MKTRLVEWLKWKRVKKAIPYLLGFVAWGWYAYWSTSFIERENVDELERLIKTGIIESAELSPTFGNILIIYVYPYVLPDNGSPESARGPMRQSKPFRYLVGAPLDTQIQSELQASGARIRFKGFSIFPTNHALRTALFALFSALLTSGLSFLLKDNEDFEKELQEIELRAKRAIEELRAEATKIEPTHSSIRFADVAGIEAVQARFEELLTFIREPDRFRKRGARLPQGLLLEGPPGVGKTFVVLALAGEAQIPVYMISGSDFGDKYVGVGADRVRALFKTARENAPCVIFIDEIDAVGRKRTSEGNEAARESDRVLNQLLIEIGKIDENKGVIVIAATNRGNLLDPALTRPGRFDERIFFTLPRLDARMKILKAASKRHGLPLDGDVDFELLGRATAGMSSAELDQVVNQAALCAARRDGDTVTLRDFEEGRDNVLMGSTSGIQTVLFPRDRAGTALHEGGHAVAAYKLPDPETATSDIVHVSIRPVGRTLGRVIRVPREDRMLVTKTMLLNEIAIIFGGRIAELRAANDELRNVSAGAADDLARANELAHQMVCEYGFGTKTRMTLPHPPDRDMRLPEAALARIDDDVQEILAEAERIARQVLDDNWALVLAVARALEERQTLTLLDLDGIAAQLAT